MSEEGIKGLVGSRIRMNGEWNVVKVKYLPHVTPVAKFQCGNLARREEAGSAELPYLQNQSFLPGQQPSTEDRQRTTHNMTAIQPSG